METGDEQGAGCEIQKQSGGNQSAARSYECTFCKRGFTNAQALGGHMNIHRKEKAKLKQSTSMSLLSSNKKVVDTPKMIPTPTRLPWIVSSAAEGHGQTGGKKHTTFLTLEETLIGEVRQLPLFIEKPLDTDQKLEIHRVLPSEFASDQNIGPSIQHGFAISELDLELRLGPEPQNDSTSSPTSGYTRHFF